MEKFTRLEGLVAPLDRANVDTDAIIPGRFLSASICSTRGVIWIMESPGRTRPGASPIPISS
jgi:hypothetical protein